MLIGQSKYKTYLIYSYNKQIENDFSNPDHMKRITPPEEPMEQIHSSASEIIVEEFVGEGDGEGW